MMPSIHAGFPIIGFNDASYALPLGLDVHEEQLLFVLPFVNIPIYLKRIRRKNQRYNWKAVAKIHRSLGYEIRVCLRNPETLLESKEIVFNDFNYRKIKENTYDGWQVTEIYVYSEDDGFIGCIEDAIQLYNKNIIPFKTSPNNPYCLIGFNQKSRTWYAWRTLNFHLLQAFTVGTHLKHGDETFVPANSYDLFCHIQAIIPKYDTLTVWEDPYPSPHITIEVKTQNVTARKIFGFPKSWGHGVWTAQTLDDAKQMAVEYAERSPYVIQGEN